MNFRSYHCYLKKAILLKDLRPPISKTFGEDFNPVFCEAAKWTKTQFANIGLRISIPLYREDLEFFINKKTNHALAFRIVTRAPDQTVLDILDCYLENKEQDTIKSLKKAFEVNINEGSFIETNVLLNRVQKRLGKLSSNGKVLANNALRPGIRRLYDDGTRSKITAIVDTYGDNVLPLEAIKELLKEKRSSVKKLCDDPELFKKEYLIVCNKCGTLCLTFPTEESAKNALADSNNYCDSCGKKDTLVIIEGYQVIEATRRGIQQGLWLESLTSDVISELTSHVWSGQMVDTNELDVLSIYCDKILLIECKDTSFGQNDFYVTAMKAQDIQANIVIIITTHDIHPNVQNNIDKYKDEGERTFRIIIKTSAEEIKSSLKTNLNEIQNNYITEWFHGDLNRYFLPHRIPRRIIRSTRF